MAYSYPRKPKNNKKYNYPKRYIKKRSTKPKTALAVANKALKIANYNSKLARGSYQTNLHFSRTSMAVTAASPACFHLVTPTEAEQIWQFLPVGGTTAYAPQAVTLFQKPTLAQLTGGVGNAAHNVWDDANDDVLNGKYYLQTMNLSFTATSLPNQPQSVRFRIDFVRQRDRRNFRQVTASGTAVDGQNTMLPDCLGAFNNILNVSNRINPMYFEFVRKPIFFTVAPPRLYDNAGTLTPTIQTVQRHCKMSINTTYNPRDVGNATTDNNKPYLSIPNNQQVWCIISTDCVEGSPDQIPQISITRQFSWRDRAGHAA
jgi:hypothetical protein